MFMFSWHAILTWFIWYTMESPPLHKITDCISRCGCRMHSVGQYDWHFRWNAVYFAIFLQLRIIHILCKQHLHMQAGVRISFLLLLLLTVGGIVSCYLFWSHVTNSASLLSEFKSFWNPPSLCSEDREKSSSLEFCHSKVLELNCQSRDKISRF